MKKTDNANGKTIATRLSAIYDNRRWLENNLCTEILNSVPMMTEEVALIEPIFLQPNIIALLETDIVREYGVNATREQAKSGVAKFVQSFHGNLIGAIPMITLRAITEVLLSED